MDPGLGKTAITLDYAGLLALKSPTGEARVLVVTPLVAVDTWVIQAETFVSPSISFWAEAVGGSLLQRAEALASRGGNARRSHLTDHGKVKQHGPRALHHELSWAFSAVHRDPARLRPVTASEGPDALPTPRLVIEVINIDTLVSRTRIGGQTMADIMVDAIRRYNPDLLVVDESHKIKSPMGNASRLLARVTPHVRRRVILTGTVMPHSPLDVFAQWRFLDPYAFGERTRDGSRRQATYAGFRDRYAIMGGWMGREVLGYRNLDDMQAVMARNAVVARKEEALDLPATQDVVIPVELGPGERRAYAEMRDQLATQLATGAQATVPNRLTQMLRLQQITSGHLPDDTGRIALVGRSKVATIASLVNDTLQGEQRVVVFALFTVEIGMLRDALSVKGTEVAVIEGGTALSERTAIRQRFGNVDAHPGRMVLVAQIKTMSLAVNELVSANHAVFGSMGWMRDDWVQAKGRLDRQGQTRPVTFWHALAPGTVDEVVYQSHLDRTDMETAVLAHIRGREISEMGVASA
jgi:SNF2 family DNA or RNA helicase